MLFAIHLFAINIWLEKYPHDKDIEFEFKNLRLVLQAGTDPNVCVFKQANALTSLL